MIPYRVEKAIKALKKARRHLGVQIEIYTARESEFEDELVNYSAQIEYIDGIIDALEEPDEEEVE